MNRYSTNKQALIIAALVIILCLVSITGATLALFTSSTEDGTIGVIATAGNLKVDIVDATDTENSLVGGVLEFLDANGATSPLFEPGGVYRTVGFRIQNDGTIPIDYIVYISEDASLSADFADAFEVWITNEPTGRSDMVKLQEFDGSLEVDGLSDVYYLVFRMKESAGNEFQNRLFSGIGITVCAVQGNVING